ncbi:MAG: sulfotransferase [Novosphingobium sp.]
MTLTAAEIIAEAEKQVGFRDSETHLHRNLEVLVSSLDQDGRLSKTGRDSVRRSLVSRSADRIDGLKWLSRHPEIAAEPIEAPIFLTGLPRSGTTYLQYLFDRDRRFRLIRTWEAMMPSPPPATDPESVAQRKAKEGEIRSRMRPEVPGFAALHLHDEGGSEECHPLLEQAYAAAGFLNLYDVPTYFDVLMDEVDMDAAYRVHKRQLQLLQWQSAPKRWAVKYPNHVIAMSAIERVYPDARFVLTHRDPVQVLGSICKMTLSLRSVRYEPPVDRERVGQQMARFIRRHIDRIMAYCASPAGERVVHLDYYRLLADPTPHIEHAHRELGLDTPDDVREAIGQWRRDNPKNARGTNEYALEQFGLQEGEMRELFSDYATCFDVPTESEGLARVGAAA